MEAWTPFMQVQLAWITLYWLTLLKDITNLQHGIITIPKSTKEHS